MTTAFQCIVNSAKRRTSPTCPFKGKAPNGAIPLKVPLKLRGALLKAEKMAERAAKIKERSTLRDGREWLWDSEIADAILTLVWESLQKGHGKSRAHHPHFYERWQFSFVRT